MSSAAWPVSDFWLETPSFGPGSHDLRGKGQVVIDADGIHVVIRPRGLAGIVIPTKERRTFPMGHDSMVGGLLTTTGESLPVHVCRLTCADDKVPLAMTERLLALGLDRSRIGRH